jgi:hypothetical protein
MPTCGKENSPVPNLGTPSLCAHDKSVLRAPIPSSLTRYGHALTRYDTIKKIPPAIPSKTRRTQFAHRTNPKNSALCLKTNDLCPKMNPKILGSRLATPQISPPFKHCPSKPYAIQTFQAPPPKTFGHSTVPLCSVLFRQKIYLASFTRLTPQPTFQRSTPCPIPAPPYLPHGYLL